MIEFMAYIYYRGLKFYGVSYKAASVLQLTLGINLATIVIFILKSLVKLSIVDLHEAIFPFSMTISVGSYILMVTFVLIYIWLKEDSINEKINLFSTRSAKENYQTKKAALIYIFASFALFIITFGFY
jgi:hypothetical protein